MTLIERLRAGTVSPADLDAAADALERAEWRDIASAPKDGMAFQARIPGHGEDNIIAWCGDLLDGNEEDCGGWYFADDQEPPGCWTDGVCWASNAENIASIQPTHWKHITAHVAGTAERFNAVPGGSGQADAATGLCGRAGGVE